MHEFRLMHEFVFLWATESSRTFDPIRRALFGGSDPIKREHIRSGRINHSLQQNLAWSIVRWCLICFGRMAAVAWPQTAAFCSTLYTIYHWGWSPLFVVRLLQLTVDWRGCCSAYRTWCTTSSVTFDLCWHVL